MIPSTARIQKGNQATNPYYLSKSGEAVLKDGKVIKGKFYYNAPPTGEDLLYFYDGDIKALQKIPVSSVSKISFRNKTNYIVQYTWNGDGLVRQLSDGTSEKLNTKVLRHIDE